MDSIEEDINSLRKILANFKKAPNRAYRKSTLNNKIKEAKEIKSNIQKKINCNRGVFRNQYVGAGK